VRKAILESLAPRRPWHQVVPNCSWCEVVQLQVVCVKMSCTRP